MRLKADPKSKNLASEESIFARAVPRWSERSDFFRFPAQIRAFYVFSASLFSCCRPVTDVTAPPPPFVDGPGRFVDRTKVRAEEHLLEPGAPPQTSHAVTQKYMSTIIGGPASGSLRRPRQLPLQRRRCPLIAMLPLTASLPALRAAARAVDADSRTRPPFRHACAGGSRHELV